MGFPGDGIQDKDPVHPPEECEPVVEGGNTEINETVPSPCPSGVQKHKASVPVPRGSF